MKNQDHNLSTNSAKNIFLASNRFDLIFKYLYIANKENYQNKNNCFINAYLHSIKIFNNFHEREPLKSSPEDFINSFDNLITSIKNTGFDSSKSKIPVDKNYEILNGAHRLTTAFFFNKKITLEIKDEPATTFDYNFFNSNFINKDIADLGALEFVKLNKKTFIVNIHSCVDTKLDSKIEKLITRHSKIYYKKNINLNENAYFYLKKINYGHEPWAIENDYKKLKEHAIQSMGPHPLRAYVIICKDIQDTVNIKKEVRSFLNRGNQPIHINDSHYEAVLLSQLYFNNNSIEVINKIKSSKHLEKLDSLLIEFKKYIKDNSLDSNNFCITGSSLLAICGMRSPKDLDFIHFDHAPPPSNKDIASHNETQSIYYTKSIDDIILDSNNHFYYSGIKFVKPLLIREMKFKRSNSKKDLFDIKLIDSIFKNKKYNKKLELIKIKFKILARSFKKSLLKLIAAFIPNRNLRHKIRDL